jgi:hypothetical protein
MARNCCILLMPMEWMNELINCHSIHCYLTILYVSDCRKVTLTTSVILYFAIAADFWSPWKGRPSHHFYRIKRSILTICRFLILLLFPFAKCHLNGSV